LEKQVISSRPLFIKEEIVLKSVILDQVNKHFNGKGGVRNVDIHIQPGEFFTFLGPSGCGKTTTLRMIAGFYHPNSGRILFGDRDVTYLQPNKRNTGMVFQNYALFPHLSVFENIAFGLRVRKQSKAEIKEKVERAQKLVRLDGYGDRRIDQLSGGQQQRVALARALVIEPEILLLDEPLSNLDAKLREETRIEIKRLQMELGVTTVYVTHDQAEAMTMSDRIMVMNEGEIQQIGTPQEIYNRPANRFVSSFIGESNLIEGIVEEANYETVKVRISDHTVLTGRRKHAAPGCAFDIGQRIFLSVRPESVRQTGQDDTTNVVTGVIKLAEFTGLSVNYLVQTDAFMLKALFVNTGGNVHQMGQTISLIIPPEAIYFVEE
jgi:iron(III) transport system ATP-binding protein